MLIGYGRTDYAPVDQTDNGVKQVPADQVTNVIYRTQGRWIVGTLVAVTLVVVIVVALSRDSHRTDPQCQPTTTPYWLRNPGVRAALVERLTRRTDTSRRSPPARRTLRTPARSPARGVSSSLQPSRSRRPARRTSSPCCPGSRTR